MLNSATDRDKASLTPYEHDNDLMLVSLEQLLTMALHKSYRPPNPYDDAGFGNVVTEIVKHINNWFSEFAAARHDESQRLLTPVSAGLSVPNWLYFHSAFLCLDLCRFVLATLDYLLTQEKVVALLEPNFLQTMAAQMKESISETCKTVHQHAVECRQRLQAPETVRDFSRAIVGRPSNWKDPVGREIRELIGEPVMDEIVTELLASWVDALNGIIDINVF